MYKEDLIKLILKGVFGLIIGVIVGLASGTSTDASFALFIGIYFIGVPYGWQLSGKLFGGTVVFGSVLWTVATFFIRFIVAFVVGGIAYPIALVYTIIKVIRE